MTDGTKTSSAPSSTILVVEDDVLIRSSICQYLRECGYLVIEAANADEALVLLKSDIALDLVLTDVQTLGALDGFGLAKWIRANKKDVEVILVGTPESAAHAAGDLCEEGPHMTKPYEPQALADLIRRHLGLTRR